MFKNRTLQLKLINSRKATPEPSTPPSHPVDPSDIVMTVAVGTMVVIATYMAADTLRQSIIYTVCTKVK